MRNSVLKKHIVLKSKSQYDDKWMNCDFRHLTDENMLAMLYNTLVQDGELIQPFPPKMYSNVAGTRIAYRGE